MKAEIYNYILNTFLKYPFTHHNDTCTVPVLTTMRHVLPLSLPQ